jgi:sporulation protein YlmC with PRC-barrel domain
MNTKRTIFGIALVLALTLAACAPGGTDLTPIGTSPAEETGLPATTGPGAGTETAATQPATEAVATSAPTQETGATTVGTPAGTSQATQEATEPILIRASDLVNLEIMDESGTKVGMVNEVLVDEEGQVEFVVLDADEALGTGPNLIAVPWDMFTIEPGDETLMFTGTEADLTTMATLDESVLAEPGFVVTGQQTGTVSSEFQNLVRVGKFTDFNLRNAEDEDLGKAEDLVIDLKTGQVRHTLVDLGGFLGIGEKTVAVPWDQLDLTLNANQTEESFFLLDIPKETLEQAPAIEDIDAVLPRWPETIEPTWDQDVLRFWQTLGSQ